MPVTEQEYPLGRTVPPTRRSGRPSRPNWPARPTTSHGSDAAQNAQAPASRPYPNLGWVASVQ